MDLNQITAAQTQSQNQLRFDAEAFEAAIKRKERNIAWVCKVGRFLPIALQKIVGNCAALRKIAQRRLVR